MKLPDHPVCCALVVCRSAARHTTSSLPGHNDIRDTLPAVMATSFPFTLSQCVLYVSLFNLPPNSPVRLTILLVPEHSDEPLMRHDQPLTMRAEDRLALFDFWCQLGATTFPTPGRYFFCVAVDGRLVGARPFGVDYPDEMF